MPFLNIARIAVENTSFSFDKLFDYVVPDKLVQKARPGCRVIVPFGRGNRKRTGIIMELSRSDDLDYIKPVESLLDEEPLLSDEMLRLAVWMKEKYFCPLFDAAKPMLPAGLNIKIVTAYKAALNAEELLKRESLDMTQIQIARYLIDSGGEVKRDRLLEIMGLSDDYKGIDALVSLDIIEQRDISVRRVGDAVVRMVRLCNTGDNEEERKLTEKQRKVVDFLLEAGTASAKELSYFTGVSQAIITNLQKKGVVEFYTSEVFRTPQYDPSQRAGNEIILTDEQNKAFDGMYSQYLKHGGSVSLLYGVTGSGKTQVFMKLCKEVADEGRQVIVMVPEIALTPQTMSHFLSRFGDNVAILHSGLSLAERLDEWKRIKTGRAKIVVGTRSAVFAPCSSLGLIIMDEEQEHTYKSEGSPRYSARDIARFRAAYHKGLLVLASATPSIESYYQAKTGKYALNTLTERFGNAVLPETQIVDLRQENMGDGIISGTLGREIDECLNDKKQIILLHNRRGHNTFVSCRSCGHVFTCPNCSISMTYHSANGMLMCHYCGYSREFARECPVCGKNSVRYSGFGTQRIEQELSDCYPDARILRLDADSIMSRHAFETKLNEFDKGYYDIMVGTQMVAKGLDFPNVTLVGVLLADQIMYGNDFRAFERAFSMLTQVVGRSGRGQYKGKALIQTYTPENPLIELAAKQDYDEFYNGEIDSRRIMLYPPFCDICMIGFTGRDRQQTERAAFDFFNMLRSTAQTDYSDLPMRVLGPSVAGIPKISGSYRYRIIIKCRDTSRFREMTASLLRDCGKKKCFDKITVFADMNPLNIL